MLTPPGPDLDVGALLDRVEGIAPIEAVEAAAEALAEMLDARELTFLIADFSGRAVVRLTTGAAGAEGARLQAGAQAETLPLSGTVYERVLRTQEVDVHALDDGARLIAPVTERGDAIGLRELVLPAHPAPTVVADVAAAARMRWSTSSSPPAGTPACSSGDSAPRRSPWPPRSSVDCCRSPTPVRPGSSPSPAGWNRRPRWAVTPSTTRSTGMRCTCRPPTPSATRSRPLCCRRCSSGRC